MKQLFPMKQLRCLLAALLVLTLSSCSYDDSDLWNSVNGLSERLDQLENSMQEDINSLKSLLEKLNQQEVTVDSAVETADGWTVTFSDGTTVTIARGGSDNWSPVLVIVEEAGDFWWAYRTAEGDTVRLTDAEGNPIPAAAVAPRVRINPETGMWEISADGGTTWENTGVAASQEEEEPGFFNDVRFEDGMLVVELLDGTVIRLPATGELRFTFDTEGPLEFSFGETLSVDYTMTGAVNTQIGKPDGWKVAFNGDKLDITAPVEENTFAEQQGKISVIALSAAGLSVYAELEVSVAASQVDAVDLNADGGYANCYIVTQPNTTYLFDATVMGNGIATAGLDAPTRIEPKDVLVLWETGTEVGGVISSVELTPEGKVLFTTSGTINGNAVIAVTDGVPVTEPFPRKRGTILWSWHIWATNEVKDVACTNNAGEQFTIMDRNLGDWTQPEGSLSTYDGLKYQWGRKDPYVGFNSYGSILDGSLVYGDADYVPMVGYATSTTSDAATLLEAIQYPEMFFTGTYNNMFDWYGLGGADDAETLTHRNDHLWGNPDETAPVKTIYDPCPEGYMVAPVKVFTGFTSTGNAAFDSSSILAEGSFADGWTFTNAHSFFPAAGQMANNSGVLRLIPGPQGREGYYWTSSVDEGRSKIVDFNASYVMYNSNMRASGCSVRCVRVF